MLDTEVRQVNSEIHAMQESGSVDPRLLAMAVEINQRYIEYLEELVDICVSEQAGKIINFDKEITVEVDGERVKFCDDDDFANWLTEFLS